VGQLDLSSAQTRCLKGMHVFPSVNVEGMRLSLVHLPSGSMSGTTLQVIELSYQKHECLSHRVLSLLRSPSDGVAEDLHRSFSHFGDAMSTCFRTLSASQTRRHSPRPRPQRLRVCHGGLNRSHSHPKDNCCGLDGTIRRGVHQAMSMMFMNSNFKMQAIQTWRSHHRVHK
jgi:hypothetical protein